ncbi:MAG: type pantothenate kinase [Clostridiales bacterium]|nr:type pantothenate kinase [Clostridiales bacterium]MDN5283604.1 type pantothenate kinase [Candidatus Ozemobacter sp.]
MILCLDVGNTQVYGGVYHEGKLKLQFRRRSITEASSDETGVFFRTVLRENGIDPDLIKRIAICSVVPEAVHSLRNACIRYFNITPFQLGPGVKCGLNIKYRNPVELGSDRIANAVAAVQKYPGRNIVIIDMGTATTFCVVSAEREFLGGAIVPGMRISMEVLESKTARLSSVEIIKASNACGRSTVEGIQSGLYFGTLGMIKEITRRLSEECFGDEKPLIIGTGGFAGMYAESGVYDELVPDLVLSGIYHSLLINSQQTGS